LFNLGLFLHFQINAALEGHRRSQDYCLDCPSNGKVLLSYWNVELFAPASAPASLKALTGYLQTKGYIIGIGLFFL
jgi:hypothetical protein